jgi:hypothetical protein
MPTEKTIFISHRFADKAIADVVRKHFHIWGFDNAVFQASAPGFGPRVGEFIADDIGNALYAAKLVILIYTLTDYDWSFCMWECGLATNPRNADTKTIVLQCNPHETPKIFEGQLLVKVTNDGIKNFVTQLHKDENFFPGEPPYRPNIAEEIIASYSESFLRELQNTIPCGQREERPRWDFVTLRSTQVDVATLKCLDEPAALAAIPEKCHVFHEFGEALKHLGYANTEADLKLSDLIDRWSHRTSNRENIMDDWKIELSKEIHRGIINSPAEANWKKMNSVTYANSWFYPVVNHVRIIPDGSMEFDVYLYKVPPS